MSTAHLSACPHGFQFCFPSPWPRLAPDTAVLTLSLCPQHVGAGADRDPHGAGRCGQQRLPPCCGHLHGGSLHLHC